MLICPLYDVNAIQVRNNSETLEDYKKILKDVDAVTDFPGCAFWEQILEAFPEAKVIAIAGLKMNDIEHILYQGLLVNNPTQLLRSATASERSNLAMASPKQVRAVSGD